MFTNPSIKNHKSIIHIENIISLVRNLIVALEVRFMRSSLIIVFLI